MLARRDEEKAGSERRISFVRHGPLDLYASMKSNEIKSSQRQQHGRSKFGTFNISSAMARIPENKRVHQFPAYIQLSPTQP